MNYKKYSSSQISQLKQDQLHHLHFTPTIPTIARAHSLSKVPLEQPTFTPNIHDIPFHIYPQRTKT